MAYPTWPSGVPYHALVDSWQQPDMYQDPRVTDMEGGNKRLMTRPGDDIYRITFNIIMTKAQLTTLKTWILTDLGRGTSRFSMTIWNGSAEVTAIVQFASKPSPSTNEPKVIVGMDLHVFPRLV